MAKRPNPMAVQQVLTYTVEEAAGALGVTPATVRNYVRRGLTVMSSKRPALMSGRDIREFLRAERKAKKAPLAFDELRCPSCCKGRRPFGMLVDLERISPSTAILKGLCERCEASSSRFIAIRQIPEFGATFDITERADRTA
ncbi:MAG: helix-turn-helix domain-containing protein [Aliishimia sp.]